MVPALQAEPHISIVWSFCQILPDFGHELEEDLLFLQ